MSTTAPQVTARILELLQTAADALNQAQYEGSHTLRQDPAPSADSPWARPDLPQDIASELTDVRIALDRLSLRAARNHLAARTAEYEQENGIVHMRYAG